jgi:hypothetical protein
MKDLRQLPLELERRALGQDVISFNKLARESGLGKVTPENYRLHPLHDAFGLMDDEDISKGLPLRTALVFSEVLNRPGYGFFVTLAKRRGISISESRQHDEWIEELRQLQEHYRLKMRVVIPCAKLHWLIPFSYEYPIHTRPRTAA